MYSNLSQISLKNTGDAKVINSYFQAVNAHTPEICDQYVIAVENVYDAFMGEDKLKKPEKTG